MGASSVAEWQVSGTLPLEGATLTSNEKDRELAPQSGRVAGVAPTFQNGAAKAPPVPPCALCGETQRWRDQYGIYRCVRCVPPGEARP